MTQTANRNLVTVAFAANATNVLPQRIHKYIRDNELPTYEDPRTKKRMVDLDEVKAKLAVAPTRGRPAKELGTGGIDGVGPSSILVRIQVQEVMRSVHTITNESEEGIYSLRSSKDPEGFKDCWRQQNVKEMLEQDKLFLIDRWAFLQVIAESFDVTGDAQIAESIRELAKTEQVASEERKTLFIDEHRGRMIEAEEARRLAAAANKDRKEGEF